MDLTNAPSVSIVMPAYNEAAGIIDFLEEISKSFDGLPLRMIVVDDASKDATADTVEGWARDSHGTATLIRSTPNAGHGPTTMKALRAGLDSGSDVVIAVDGDGQFIGEELRRAYDLVTVDGVDVVEGVRRRPDAPGFRRVASAGTQALVASRCGKLVKDANTPLRAYRRPVLQSLLRRVPDAAMTPNLHISALSREQDLSIVEVPVVFQAGRGAEATGSTWKQRSKVLPSRRFVTFCARATREWFTTTPHDTSSDAHSPAAAQPQVATAS